MMIRMFLLALAALLPGSARAAWHEATSTHFIVYSEGSQQQARDFAAKLERFHFVLRTTRPPPDDTTVLRLRVFLVQDRNAVGRLVGSGSVAGYYIPDARGLMMVGTRGEHLSLEQVSLEQASAP